jgi:hypothetical protein
VPVSGFTVKGLTGRMQLLLGAGGVGGVTGLGSTGGTGLGSGGGAALVQTRSLHLSGGMHSDVPRGVQAAPSGLQCSGGLPHSGATQVHTPPLHLAGGMHSVMVRRVQASPTRLQCSGGLPQAA